jgi:hypothetical protein
LSARHSRMRSVELRVGRLSTRPANSLMGRNGYHIKVMKDTEGR